MTIYIVNNTGIHTTETELNAHYFQLSFESFCEYVKQNYAKIHSLIGHDSVIDHLNIILPDHPFIVNRVSSDYKSGDICVGMKPTTRLPETHDFHSSFLSKFYKYYMILFENWDD